jgi:two-component system response regulator AtoC
MERQIILKVLEANGWSRRKTAKWLNISYRSLLYKLQDAHVREVKETPSRARTTASKSTSAPPSLPPKKRSSTGDRRAAI